MKILSIYRRMDYFDLNYSGHNSIQLFSEAVLQSNLFLNYEVGGWHIKAYYVGACSVWIQV